MPGLSQAIKTEAISEVMVMVFNLDVFSENDLHDLPLKILTL